MKLMLLYHFTQTPFFSKSAIGIKITDKIISPLIFHNVDNIGKTLKIRYINLNYCVDYFRRVGDKFLFKNYPHTNTLQQQQRYSFF